jgi:hypothetical protein
VGFGTAATITKHTKVVISYEERIFFSNMSNLLQMLLHLCHYKNTGIAVKFQEMTSCMLNLYGL